MGRRSAGGNDQQRSVADLLRAASSDNQPHRSRRHGESNLVTARDDRPPSAVALSDAQDESTPASPEQNPEQGTALSADLAAPPADIISADESTDERAEPADDLAGTPRESVDTQKYSAPAATPDIEQLIETTDARELPNAQTVEDADPPRSSASGLLKSNPAAHSAAPRTLSDVGPTDDLDTAEVPAVDKDPAAASSLQTTGSESVEVESTSNASMPSPAKTESAPLAQPEPTDQSATTSWFLAIGEVVLAIVIGAGLAYVFRLLWDIYPYVAAVIAPLVICGVIGVVGLARKRLRQGAIPLSLLLVILFITGLLVVLPAAWVMTTR